MSGLLHIKRFRQNMLKMFAIYLVVILSTTSVITYSRYITSMESTSYARPARFNIDITKGDICVADTTICKLSSELTKFKPYDQLDYYFSVDTSQLEVTTIMATTIDIDTHYNFVGIYEIEDEVETLIDINNNDDYSISGRRINISQEVEAGLGTVKTYKIRLSYIENSETDQTYDAISVDFVATQKD